MCLLNSFRVLSNVFADALGARDLKVELINGAYHDIDSSVISFELAAKQAMMKAIQDFGL